MKKTLEAVRETKSGGSGFRFALHLAARQRPALAKPQFHRPYCSSPSECGDTLGRGKGARRLSRFCAPLLYNMGGVPPTSPKTPPGNARAPVEISPVSWGLLEMRQGTTARQRPYRGSFVRRRFNCTVASTA